MKYQQPYGISDPNAAYINGNPSTGTMGSIPPAASIEFPQREIVNFITESGLTPDNAQLTQLAQGVQNGVVAYAADIGAINALAVTLNPVPLAYYTGQRLWVKVKLTSSGAATIDVNGLGIKTITRANGATLLPGDLIINGIACLAYDGTKFLLISNNGSTLQRATRATYTTPGAASFTALVPGSHKFYLWGGGGGGGYGGTGGAASGGSGGAYIEFTRVLAASQVCSLLIGAGGAAGNAGANGGAGGASQATVVAETLTAGGGPGGLTNAAGGSTNSPNIATVTGAADRGVIGEQGGPGYVTTSPGAAGGYGGSSPVGGLGGVGGGGASGGGAAPGGGGGGSANAQVSQPGGRGEIWVEY